MKTETGRGLVLRVIAATAVLAAGPASAGPADLCFRGINLSGAEYGDANGQEGINFFYPTEKTVSYFAAKGFDTVRLPFKWERLQPALGQPLDPVELARLKKSVAGLRAKGLSVILDPHNFGYYGPDKIASDKVTTVQFARFWAELAVEFANMDGIAFGLMNEPHDLTPRDWLTAANDAIAGIRAAGARNLILVPGTYWSGAVTWSSDPGQGANSAVMLGVTDPAENYAYEIHQYMDRDFSGTAEACARADDAVAGLSAVTRWLRDNGKRGFLGEFGGSQDPACLQGLTRMTDEIAANSDVWLGWTYWAGGDWWSPEEGNNIQPTAAGDRRQMNALGPALGSKGTAHGICARIQPER